jgi:hypothetical protein
VDRHDLPCAARNNLVPDRKAREEHARMGRLVPFPCDIAVALQLLDPMRQVQDCFLIGSVEISPVCELPEQRL